MLANSSSLRQRDAITLLQTHPIFGALTPKQIEQLSARARVRRLAAGTTLFVKGDPGTALFAIVNGTVKISVPSIAGREATFNVLHRGEIFGEIALLDGQMRSADAVALTDCELMVIERSDFVRLVRAEPMVSIKIIEHLCTRLRLTSERMEEVVFLDLSARLARLLLSLRDNVASDQNRLAITQHKISEILGTSRESVNKHLQIWVRRNLIVIKRGCIIILAPQALATIAGSQKDDDGIE
jgi:CRP-like cAMP-binding protein